MTVLDGVTFTVAGRDAASLSGGQRARVGLAAILASRADVLLLDEPTNDVDLAGLERLERFVTTSEAAMVIVSHDRAFLSRTITGVIELDEHRRTATQFDGGWDAYLAERATARQLAETRYGVYVEQRQRLKDRAQREQEWAHRGVRKAKSKATDGDKCVRSFRKAQSEQLAGRAARTERALERLDAVDKPWEGWELRLQIAAAARPGDRVVELSGAVVRRGSFALGPVDLAVGVGERVGIVGRNGEGKSTLLGAMLGDLALAAGTRYQGPGVVVGRMAQTRDRFSGGATLLDAFCAETGVVPNEARSTLAKLGLGTEAVFRPAGQLSPGERTRAVLAAFQAQGVNLLVLDEPTNHLDLLAIEQLEAALESYDGTVLLVSHDRAFLSAVRLTRRVELSAGQVVADGPTATTLA
jgi:ATPase subunit of ABC transporter with duplicated ATPase domains